MQRVLGAIGKHAGSLVNLSCASCCPTHNIEVRGGPNSQHIKACAENVLVVDVMSINELAEITDKSGADGIGQHYDSLFVHVDTRGYVAR